MPIFRRLAAAALIAAGLVCSLHAQSSDPAAERGFAALQRGDADAAAAVFQSALALRPRDAVLLYGAGLAANLQGRDDDAARLLKRAVEAEPRLTPAALALGEIACRRTSSRTRWCTPSRRATCRRGCTRGSPCASSRTTRRPRGACSPTRTSSCRSRRCRRGSRG